MHHLDITTIAAACGQCFVFICSHVNLFSKVMKRLDAFEKGLADIEGKVNSTTTRVDLLYLSFGTKEPTSNDEKK